MSTGSGREVPWRLIDHTADVGFSIRGRTARELFENAARCLCELLSVTKGVSRRARRRVRLRAESREDLIRVFLAELLFLSYARGLVLVDARIDSLTPTALVATVAGELYDPERHERHPEVKAVTYHGLSVRRLGRGWEARVILDL